MSDLGPVDTERSHAADDVVARLERLPTSRFHVHLAAMLGVGTFFDAFDALTIASALPVIFVTLHIGFVNSGILLSSGFASAIVGAAGFGLLSEVLGRKFAYVSALFLFGGATIATGFAQSWQQLLALRIVQELGIGGELPVAAAMMNEFIRGRTRGRVGGIYQSLFAWGTLLSPVVSLFILSIFGPALGWRVIFWVGGVTVPLAIYAIFRLPESPRWLAEKG
jgi:putative MFS transporter